MSVKVTKQFKKDYKKAVQRGLDIELLDRVVTDIAEGKPLNSKYKDHLLKGDYENCRECHILPDWLLIYKVESSTVTFVRTGTHSDLFR